MQSTSNDGLHVAIIMDGNGRWASRRGLPRVAGHRAGVATAKRIIERAPDVGIRCLTLYAFSSDNWSRPAGEVRSIFWLLRAFLRLERERMRQQGVRLEAIGRRDRLPQPALREIERAEWWTAEERRLLLRVAIDYSAREVIARAAAQASAGRDAGAAMPDRQARQQTPQQMSAAISQTLTVECGEVDLLIRTGGEKRLSDFLLWESAYAELHFTDRMWPDFDETDLDAALAEFSRRERRFGGVPAGAPAQVIPIAGVAR